MSREHYIADAVLRIIETSGGVEIHGFPWQKKQRQRVPRSGMVARVLCTRHNAALSPLDAEAARFIRVMSRFNADFNATHPQNDLSFFAGEDIERWMLKTPADAHGCVWQRTRRDVC